MIFELDEMHETLMFLRSRCWSHHVRHYNSEVFTAGASNGHAVLSTPLHYCIFSSPMFSWLLLSIIVSSQI